jgi:hypothetical protein
MVTDVAARDFNIFVAPGPQQEVNRPFATRTKWLEGDEEYGKHIEF